MTTPDEYVVIRAEIQIDGTHYTAHTAVPARTWETVSEQAREAFRDHARQRLTDHLANALLITVTTETITAPAAG